MKTTTYEIFYSYTNINNQPFYLRTFLKIKKKFFKESIMSPSLSNAFRNLPCPILEKINIGVECWTWELFEIYTPLISKLAELTLVYIIGCGGFGYGWVVLFSTLYYLKCLHKSQVSETVSVILSSSQKDFEKVEWLNTILVQLWPKIASYATDFSRQFIQPVVNHLLAQLQLKEISGFQMGQVILGRTPVRIEGMKVYSGSDESDDIIIDCDILYKGDARIMFTLQGVLAEINSIKFSASSRVILKPLIPTVFPVIGGFEFCFVSTPSLSYNLGGIGTFADLPGVSSILNSFVLELIRVHLVWPNRLRIHLPLQQQYNKDYNIFKLPKPAGLLTVDVLQGRNLISQDFCSSDPYAIVSVGETRISFRSKYVESCLSPRWTDVSASFVLENTAEQNLVVEIFDRDTGSSDDFMGRYTLGIESLLKEKGGVFREWVELANVKHGQIRLNCRWNEVKMANSFDNKNRFILSVYVDYACGLRRCEGGSIGSPICCLKMGNNSCVKSRPQMKTERPSFEIGHLFLTTKDEHLEISFNDFKNPEFSMGFIKFSVAYLLDQPNCELIEAYWSLEDRTKSFVSFSAKLYTLQGDDEA